MKDITKEEQDYYYRKIARIIINQLFDLADIPVGKRQLLNDSANKFVTEILKDELCLK